MPKYNKLQWYIIIFNICLLIFGNFLVVVLFANTIPISLPDFSNINIFQTNQAKVDTRFLVQVKQSESGYNSEPYEVQIDKDQEISEGFVYEKSENNFILISSPAKFRIDNNGLINLLSGIALFRPKTDTSITLGNDGFAARADSLLLIDANNKQIFVYSGSVKTQFAQATVAEKIYWAVDTFRVSSFGRNEILAISNLDLIREYSTTIGFSLPEIFKLSPPEIISVIPSSNFLTLRESIEIRGKVEVNSTLFINNNEIRVDSDGNFSTSVDLQIGNNEFTIVAFDEYLQSSNYILNIVREASVLIEPISFSVG